MAITCTRVPDPDAAPSCKGDDNGTSSTCSTIVRGESAPAIDGGSKKTAWRLENQQMLWGPKRAGRLGDPIVRCVFWRTVQWCNGTGS